MRNAILALVGLALIVVGVSLMFLPAGIMTAGVGLIVAAYVAQYLEVSRSEDA